MTKLYLVRGTTGEWSDRTEWSVAAFTDKRSALEYMTTLLKEYHSFPQNDRGYSRDDKERESLEEHMMKFDPNFEEDYTGTSWFIEYDIPLLEVSNDL
jgi:hypothetical protein